MEEQAMSVHIQQQNGQCKISVEGDFDASTANEAREAFNQLLMKNQHDNIIVDMSHSEFIDSSGVGAIIFLYKRLRCSGKDLNVVGLHEQPLSLFQLLRIDQIINLTPIE
jgi:anti-anti-sigma factor